MRRIILTVGGLAMAGLFAGCAPAYVETRPGYARPGYGPQYSNRREYRDERRERHEAREHERREWHAPEDGD
jgi:hypothetical protein